jgi:hypothetical protein
MFDRQPLPDTIDVRIFETLENVGGAINGLQESELVPNCVIKTFEGNCLSAVWYPHTRILKSERRCLKYRSVDFKGNPKEYSLLPSGWVLTENHWFPLVTRLLRVIGAKEIRETPDLLSRVSYDGHDLDVGEASIMDGRIKLLTSLGAADNPFYIVYLNTNESGDLLPSTTKDNWLVLDTKNVGYKACGVGEKVYGPGCYFGGSWACADRGSARKVDEAVCKVKNPPWPTRYFWAVIDDVVFNAGEGSSIKTGRIKILNEDQKQNIPDWVQFLET